MSEAFALTKQLMSDLEYVRWLHAGQRTQDEDDLLERLDDLWWQLTAVERDEIEQIPSTSLIAEVPAHRMIADTPVILGQTHVVRQRWEVA